MTLDDGEELNSRQAVEGDRWSSLVHRTMASSELWWTSVSSLVEAILDEAGKDSFALVVGPRILIELRPDGRLRRTQLRTFFRGNVSKLELGVFRGERKRRSNYQPVGTAPWDEDLQLEVDFGVPGSRWRLLQGQGDDGADLLPYVSRAIQPAVIVDVDAVPLGLPYREYEAGHLQGDTTLVLPHSDAAERYIRKVLEWVGSGRPPQANDWVPEISPSDRYLELENAREQVPLHEAAVVTRADFGVTALYEQGNWRDPGDLEAARAFIQVHPHLRIGILDLVGSEPLRESLLQRTVPAPVPTSPARIPTGPARRAAEYEAARDEASDMEEAFRRSLKNRFEPLLSLGWTAVKREPVGIVVVVIGQSEDFEDFVLPLTEVFDVEGKDTPLAWLAVTVNKRSTWVDVHVAIWRQFKVVRPYLEARSARLSEIAKPGKWDFRIPILWEEKGGWGDDIDWPTRVAGLRERTSQWLEVLADLGPRLVKDATEEAPTS